MQCSFLSAYESLSKCKLNIERLKIKLIAVANQERGGCTLFLEGGSKRPIRILFVLAIETFSKTTILLCIHLT